MPRNAIRRSKEALRERRPLGQVPHFFGRGGRDRSLIALAVNSARWKSPSDRRTPKQTPAEANAGEATTSRRAKGGKRTRQSHRGCDESSEPLPAVSLATGLGGTSIIVRRDRERCSQQRPHPTRSRRHQGLRKPTRGRGSTMRRSDAKIRCEQRLVDRGRARSRPRNASAASVSQNCVANGCRRIPSASNAGG